jgi:cell division control protein 7
VAMALFTNRIPIIFSKLSSFGLINGIIDKTKRYAIKVNFSTVSPELIFAEIAYLKLVFGKENMP